MMMMMMKSPSFLEVPRYKQMTSDIFSIRKRLKAPYFLFPALTAYEL